MGMARQRPFPFPFEEAIDPIVRRLNDTRAGSQADPGTAAAIADLFSGLAFYSRFILIVWKASVKAKRRCYSDRDWSRSSRDALRALEKSGVRIHISGLEHIAKLTTPCVVIGNHMSVLETVILPGVIQPLRNVAFVIKKNLMAYPVFKHVMRSRAPIVVGRANPRQDLMAVLDGGLKRLQRSISIIVFPQTTRTLRFDPQQFSTIGVKLARKAGVPVIPLALLTDAWSNGKYIKEFGRIDPTKNVHFAFGPPLWVRGRGIEEHQAVIDFIGGHLEKWKARK